MKNFLIKAWKWIILLVLFYSALCVASSFISSEYFWGFYFLAYSLPIAIVLNIVLFVLLLVFKKHVILILVSNVIVLFGLSNNWSFSTSTEDGTANYSLLSYNVRLFDLYNWLDGQAWDEWKERTDNGAVLDSLQKSILEPDADFLCFQEFFNQSRGDYKTEKFFRKNGYKHRHVAYSLVNKPNYYGIATFSKYPIVHKESHFFNKKSLNNGLLVTDIQVNTDTIRIINVHLQSFMLERDDYKYLNEISTTDSTLDKLKAAPTKQLFNKIKTAAKQRLTQLDFLMSIIEKSPHPILLCGDFNELPNSNVYRQINDVLLDAFQEAGTGLGSSLTNSIPGLRIDYIFHSKSIKAVNYEVIHKKLSDHYPVLFKFKNL